MWTLENHEREALANAAKNEFRSDVVNHALSKLKFKPLEVPRGDLQKIGEKLFDISHEFLGKYPEANYKSYVFMVMLYFIKGIKEMEKPYMKESLNNDRIGINTRVQFSYDIARIMMERGY
jgi:hypothetical protein